MSPDGGFTILCTSGPELLDTSTRNGIPNFRGTTKYEGWSRCGKGARRRCSGTGPVVEERWRGEKKRVEEQPWRRGIVPFSDNSEKWAREGICQPWLEKNNTLREIQNPLFTLLEGDGYNSSGKGGADFF